MIEQLKKAAFSGRLSAKSIIALLVFGAIVLVFVFFGMHHGDTMGGMASAARVNNSLISLKDFQEETTRMEQTPNPYLQFMKGEAKRQFLNQMALENLITMEVATQGAQKSGILVTDQEIRDVIVKDITAFQRDGRFQRDLYVQLLEANRMTPSEFEAKVRKERISQRAARLFGVVGRPTTLEKDAKAALKTQKMNVNYVRFTKPELEKKLTVSDADIAKRLADGDFAKRVESEFNSNKDRYGSPEQVRAQHILVRFEQGNADSEKAALEKIEGLQKRAASEDFGKLAAAASEDPGSKAKNGDLGYFGKGSMVPEFEQAAFTMEVGKISAPVKSEFGYHLIKVTDKKAAVTPDFEKMKVQVAKELLAQEQFDVAMKDLEEVLKKNDRAAIDAWVAKHGLGWKETGNFGLDTDLIPGLDSVTASGAAFELSSPGTVLTRIVRDGDVRFILSLKSRVTDATAKAAAEPETAQMQRAEQMFMSWVEQQKKTARIERNPQLLK